MAETKGAARAWISAIVTGLVLAAGFMALRVEQPLRIVLAGAAVAALVGLIARRHGRGMSAAPTSVLLGLGIVGLLVYARLLIASPPSGAGWLFALVVVAFPVTVLLMGVRQWKSPG
jgi:hypothetical protein